MRRDYRQSKAPHWESPVVRTHRCQMDRREKRELKSSTKVTHFAAVLTTGACMIAETVSAQRSGTKLRSTSPLFELALVFVRVDYIAGHRVCFSGHFAWNANYIGNFACFFL